MSVAWWALAVSALSLVAAISSLAWNIYIFRKGGPVVVVKFGMTFNEAILEQGFPEPLVDGDIRGGAEWTLMYCDVYNKGRSAIDVLNVTFGTTEKASDLYFWTPPDVRKLLPVRLESHSSKRFGVTAGELLDCRPPFGADLDMEAIIGFTSTVYLGDGTTRTLEIPYAEFASFAQDPLGTDFRHRRQEVEIRGRRTAKRK